MSLSRRIKVGIAATVATPALIFAPSAVAQEGSTELPSLSEGSLEDSSGLGSLEDLDFDLDGLLELILDLLPGLGDGDDGDDGDEDGDDGGDDEEPGDD